MPPSTPPSAHWFEAVPAFSARATPSPPRCAAQPRLLSRWIGFVKRCGGATCTSSSAADPLCALVAAPTCHQARALPQGADGGTALANIESALALVWQHAAARAVTAAEQVLCGRRAHAPLHLRALHGLRRQPARGRLPAALAWLDRVLADAGRPLSPATLRPPHGRLGADLRGGAAPRSCSTPTCRRAVVELAEALGPREEQRRASLRADWAVLERERLAPCSSNSRARGGRRPPPPPPPSTRRSARGRPSSGRRTRVARQSAYTQAAPPPAASRSTSCASCWPSRSTRGCGWRRTAARSSASR